MIILSFFLKLFVGINVCQVFTLKHKINKSNRKVSTHYRTICLYSMNIWYDAFVAYTVLISFEMCSTPQLSKYEKSVPYTTFQCVPINVFSSRFVTYALSFTFGELLHK